MTLLHVVVVVSKQFYIIIFVYIYDTRKKKFKHMHAHKNLDNMKIYFFKILRSWSYYRNSTFLLTRIAVVIEFKDIIVARYRLTNFLDNYWLSFDDSKNIFNTLVYTIYDF